MKRISIVVVLLMALTGMTNGHSSHYYSGYRRLRWSIHAHGLVPNDLRYNPYAHGYGRTGLVPYWVRYSPYAHGVKHPSGLVNDYACSPSSIYYCPGNNYYYSGCCRTDSNPLPVVKNIVETKADRKQTRDNDLAKIRARREEIRQLAQARKQKRMLSRNAGKETIVAYLKNRNIDFRMNRLLSMKGKVLSADFILGDGKTVISYWDPAEIQALEQQAEHRMLTYQKYVTSWKNFCAEHQRAGGNIFQIVSSDREEILAKLTFCDGLNESQTTYATADRSNRRR